MDILYSLSTANGVCSAGICPISAISSHADLSALEKLCPSAKTVIVLLFPYHVGAAGGNISVYARGRDYHTVIAEALEPVLRDLRAAYPEHSFVPLADASPLPEVRAAAAAGLGVIGENGLLITKEYGSYVFIGTVVTDFAMRAAPHPPSPCLRCGACVRACPGGAIQNGSIDQSRCLSALTQKGGALTHEQATLVAAHPLVWGCDTCQTVCPMNRGTHLSDNPAFRTQLVDSLSLPDVEQLTRRAFCEKYPNRAFTWKGPKPIERNFKLR